MPDSRSPIRLDACLVDLDAQRVRWPDGDRTLRPMEARLLGFFAEHPGRTIAESELLREVWGYRGGVVTKTVQVTISRLRSKIEAAPRSPRHLLTVAGAGYRFEVGARAAVRLEPSPEPAEDTERLEGRAADRARVLSALRKGDATLVSILGPPGVGKSWVAGEALEFFGGPGGVVGRVALRGVSAGVDAAVREALELGPGSLGDRLGPRAGVLWLDDADGVLAEVPALLAALAGTGVVVLLTARAPVGVAGELAVRLEGLSPAASVRLFRARAPADRFPGYDDDEAVAAVLEPLDGLPLAIELAAPWAAFLEPPELAKALATRLMLLHADRPDLPVEQRDLGGLLEAAYQGLSPEQRVALAAASAFRSPFTAQDLDAVARDPEAGETMPSLALLSLRALVKASWVRRLDDGLFRPWRPVATWLRRAHPVDRSAAAHAQLMSRWGLPSRLVALDRGSGADLLRAVRQRVEDLRVATLWALSHADGAVAVRCLRALLRVTPHALSTEAWATLSERVLVLGGGPEAERLGLLAEAHAAWFFSGRGGAMTRLLAEAVEGPEAAADPALRSALLRASSLLTRATDPQAALALAADALAAARDAGDPSGWGRAQTTFGSCLAAVGDVDRALDELRQGLARLRDADDAFLIVALQALASLETTKGRTGVALTMLRESRDLEKQRGQPSTMCALMLARALAPTDERAARAYFNESIALARTLKRRPDEARATSDLAEAERRWGDPTAALSLATRAARIYEALEHAPGAALASARAGQAAFDLGDHGAAERRLAEARAFGGELIDPDFRAQTAALEAELAAASGRSSDARRSFARGADHLRQAGARQGLVGLLERWAEMEAQAGNPQLAEALFEESEGEAQLTVADAPAPLDELTFC